MIAEIKSNGTGKKRGRKPMSEDERKAKAREYTREYSQKLRDKADRAERLDKENQRLLELLESATNPSDSTPPLVTVTELTRLKEIEAAYKQVLEFVSSCRQSYETVPACVKRLVGVHDEAAEAIESHATMQKQIAAVEDKARTALDQVAKSAKIPALLRAGLVQMLVALESTEPNEKKVAALRKLIVDAYSLSSRD